MPKNHPVAYGDRGNRCEGIYIRRVSASTAPILRGFHLAQPRYDSQADRLWLTIAGYLPGIEQGLIQAKSMLPRHYYQMDTDDIEASGTFVWDAGLLRHKDVNLMPENLAVLFCEKGCREEVKKVWPVSIVADGSPDDAVDVSPYVILESEVTLVQIVLTIQDTGSGAFVYENLELRRSNYPPDEAIRIPMRLPRPGDYAVTIRVTSQEGLSDQLDFVAVLPRL
ncbi:MAG: hypothetical protein KJP16_05245 [Gammaproteobacteria bacterium]|nr:hypothetical protein [Gammaproteobacteria bacterium]